MKIRVGYELTYDCPQPTPMVLMLNIHHTRVGDLVAPDRIIAEPFVPMTSYRDGFGNWCTRMLAPTGRLRLSASTLLNDTGEPDPIVRSECSTRWKTCRGVARLSPRQPLLRDRSPGQHRVGSVRQVAHRRRPYLRHLRLRPSPHRVQLSGCPIDENGVGGVRGRQASPRLRASGDRLLPLPEHSRSLLHGVSRRYRRSAAIRSHGFRRPGSRPISAGAGTRSTRGTTSRGSAACSSPVDAMRRTCRSATRSVPTRSPASESGPTRSRPDGNGRIRQCGWNPMRLLTVRHVTTYRYSER